MCCILGGTGLYESDELVRGAMELNFQMKKNQKRAVAEDSTKGAEDSSMPPGTCYEKSLFNFINFDDTTAKKAKLSVAPKQKTPSKKASSAAPGASTSSQNAQKFEFSEAGVREFISVREGGRSTVKKVLEQFKKQMKALGSGAAPRLKEILMKAIFVASYVLDMAQ